MLKHAYRIRLDGDVRLSDIQGWFSAHYNAVNDSWWGVQWWSTHWDRSDLSLYVFIKKDRLTEAVHFKLAFADHVLPQ